MSSVPLGDQAAARRLWGELRGDRGDRPALDSFLQQYTYEEDEYEGTYEEDQDEGGGGEGGGERRGWAVWLTSWSTAAITAVLMAARFAALARYAMSADEESDEYNSAALD